MADYVQLGAVRTWYDVHGAGDPLVLMHGGMVDARFFAPNLPALAEHFRVYTPERRGHGHTPDVDGPITYRLMAEETIAFLETVVGEPADLVGQSDGAFTAMLVAIQRPELVKRLVLISGGYDKAGEALPDLPFDVDQVSAFVGPAYAEVSPDGIEHLPVVVGKIGVMMQNEPHIDLAELAGIAHRTLIMFADDDLMVLPHALDMYDTIPNSELAVVPGTSHFLTQEKPALVNALVLDFLRHEPAPVNFGIRRATPPPV